MLIVKIYINITPIIDTYVVRIKGSTAKNSLNTYQLPDGRTFKHRYGDGAIALAIKTLKYLKESS